MATKVDRKILKENKKHNKRRSDLYEAAVSGDLNKTQTLVLSGAIVNVRCFLNILFFSLDHKNLSILHILKLFYGLIFYFLQ